MSDSNLKYAIAVARENANKGRKVGYAANPKIKLSMVESHKNKTEYFNDEIRMAGLFP